MTYSGVSELNASFTRTRYKFAHIRRAQPSSSTPVKLMSAMNTSKMKVRTIYKLSATLPQLALKIYIISLTYIVEHTNDAAIRNRASIRGSV